MPTVVAEILEREGASDLVVPTEAEVWSPYEAHEAAAAMLRDLAEAPEQTSPVTLSDL